MSTNEPIVSHRKIKGGSDRSFGVVFAGAFAVIALWPALSGGPVRGWSAAVAGVFLLLAAVAPATLAPLNRLWLRFGLLLGHIMSPVVMAVAYAVLVVPAGSIMRAAGKDPLRLKWDAETQTYWIAREQPAPGPGSMSKQF